jgi:hypothetical protein
LQEGQRHGTMHDTEGAVKTMTGRAIQAIAALVGCAILGLLLLVGCGSTANEVPTATTAALPKGTAIGTVPLVLTMSPNGTPSEEVQPKTPASRNQGEPGRIFPGAQPGATMPLATPGSIATPGTPGTPVTPTP